MSRDKVIFLGGPGSGSGDVVAAGNNTLTGVNSFAGSFIFPTDPISIVANAGTINIAKSHSRASISANVVLTPTGAGVAEQQICVIVVNTDTAAHSVTGAGTASTVLFTAAALSTTTTYWVSNGAAWTVIGGAVTLNDLSAITPVLADSTPLWDASGGVAGKTTYSILRGILVAEMLGSHTTPDTTGGAMTWTAPLLQAFVNTTTTYVLPVAATYAGKGVIFYNTGTNLITIDPNGSEVIVRAGTVLSAGVAMTLAGVAGNYVALFCDGVRWVTLGSNGTLG